MPYSARWLEASVSEENKQPLNGSLSYCIEFGPGALPPVYDLWSVSVYDARNRANSIERYSEGAWRDSLGYGDGGSLTLHLQHDAPDTGTTNWIPTPMGRFTVVIRLYEPSEPLLEGRCMLTPIELSVLDPERRWASATAERDSARPFSERAGEDAKIETIGFQLLP